MKIRALLLAVLLPLISVIPGFGFSHVQADDEAIQLQEWRAKVIWEDYQRRQELIKEAEAALLEAAARDREALPGHLALLPDLLRDYLERNQEDLLDYTNAENELDREESELFLQIFEDERERAHRVLMENLRSLAGAAFPSGWDFRTSLRQRTVQLTAGLEGREESVEFRIRPVADGRFPIPYIYFSSSTSRGDTNRVLYLYVYYTSLFPLRTYTVLGGELETSEGPFEFRSRDAYSELMELKEMEESEEYLALVELGRMLSDRDENQLSETP